MRIALVAIISILFGGGFGFSIGFFIFSIVLNSSNNIGGKAIRDDLWAGKLVVMSRVNKIKHSKPLFDEHINMGMRDLVANPTYQAMMDRSVKKADSELVTHEE
ncbi:MAG: hypothetical protein J5379_09250 [Clostridiales bacterium]|nr:hypothetical protein [Clostridiales bacterium]